MPYDSRGNRPDEGRRGSWPARRRAGQILCNYVIISRSATAGGKDGIGMANDQYTAAAGLPAGGRGRLAQVIATRGGLAAPEAPFVIEHREALIYMLCEAAELEHGIMCQYLFAAFSLKQNEQEGGMTAPELAAVRRWRAQVSRVATQEMLHLALVHNLLTAI